MEKNKMILSIQSEAGDYTIRSEILEGQEHWVVPVVMMVEGVHNGSKGPILYTAEELGRFPGSWNGMPVVIDHPGEGSANEPELVKSIVGRVFNTRMEGLKLKAEVWINIETLRNISEDAYEYIKEHRALEVSVGVFTDDVEESGEFNNEEYRAIAQHIRPDHLALLPNEVGACSWDDGCGVRVNKQNKKGVANVKTNEKDLGSLGIYKLAKEGYSDLFLYVSKELTVNEVGFREIMQNLQQKLDQLDNDIRIHFLEELFDDHVIYRTHNMESGETQFFKRDYVVNDDGTIEFDGDPVEVRKETTFQTVQNKTNNKMKRTKNTKSCSVDALIANEKAPWTEKDREWLELLEEEKANELVVLFEEQKPDDDEPAEKDDTQKEKDSKTAKAKEEPVASSAAKIDPKELENEVKKILSNEKDPVAFINKFMPGAMKGQMLNGLEMYNEKREQLIEGIVENSSFEKANIEQWADSDLQKLYDNVVPESDFSVLGNAGSFSTNEEKITEEGASMIALNTDSGNNKDKNKE